jgi:Mg2+ and Co2+ transporter CorA
MNANPGMPFAELNVWRYARDGTGRDVNAVAVGAEGAEGGAVVWVDFIPGTEYEAMAEAFAAMQLDGLDKAMLGYLIECADPGLGDVKVAWYDPDVEARLVAVSDVRYLHAFALMPEVPPGPVAAEELPMVYRRDVHFLVSDSWVITRRRTGMAFTRGHFDQEREPVAFDDLRRFVEAHWDDYHEPQDVATLILRALAESWFPALERISQRLANSELLYVQGLVEEASLIDECTYRRDLVDLKWIVDSLSSVFTSLRRPAVPVEKAWFETKTEPGRLVAEQVEQLRELASGELARHREQLRGSFDLVASTEASRQLELGNEERRRGERLEGVITFVTAVLLVPTLIAGVFAALPDVFHNRFHLRVWLLMGLMLGGAALTFVGLRIVRARVGRSQTAAGGEGGEGSTGAAGGPVIPSPVFLASFLFAALLVIGSWHARDREQALGVVFLSISAFLVAPQLIATPWLVAVERALFARFERRATAGPGRTRRALHLGGRVVEGLLWVALVAFAVLIVIGTFKPFWAQHSLTLLTVAYAMAPVLYFGFLLLWMTYAFGATVGADDSDALTRELVGIDAVKAPLAGSRLAGALATVTFLAGTALAYYSAWHH